MTRRRASYRSLVSLQRDNRVCRACAEAGFPIESLPVLEGRPGQCAFIYGQAPGILEGEQRRPWRGRAGQQLRRWLELDEDEFYAAFYCASVTRCYPGRAASAGGGDRVPAPREQELCSFWLDWELRLVRPELILAVGGLAIRRLLGIRGLECIGKTFEYQGATVVPLPHPSGVSRWPNVPANRARLEQALALARSRIPRG